MTVLLLCLFVLLKGVNKSRAPRPDVPSGVNEAGGWQVLGADTSQVCNQERVLLAWGV